MKNYWYLLFYFNIKCCPLPLTGLALQLPEPFAGPFRYRLSYVRLYTPPLPATHTDAGN